MTLNPALGTAFHFFAQLYVMAVPVSGASNKLLSYLGLGSLGKEETATQITPSLMTLPEGPGLHRIHEPVNAAVE